MDPAHPVATDLARPEDPERVELRRALEAAITRIERRIAAVRSDMKRVDEASAIADRAQSFVAVAARAARGTRRLRAQDWSDGSGRTIEMEIDPARDAREQVEAVFRQARRLKNGLPIARERLRVAETLRTGLLDLVDRVGAEDADLDALTEAARRTAPRDFRGVATRQKSASGHKAAPRLPYRTFVADSGRRILVGRGAQDNDALTLRVAKPRDLWLHVRSFRGAHVVVPLDAGTSCPADLLVEAAHLAAHFSDARDETTVEVEYVARRYVRKPRGSPPGAVVVMREKVILLRKEDRVLKRLLDSERIAP